MHINEYLSMIRQFFLWSLHMITSVISQNVWDEKWSLISNVTLYWRHWYHFDKSLKNIFSLISFAQNVLLITSLSFHATMLWLWRIHSHKTNQRQYIFISLFCSIHINEVYLIRNYILLSIHTEKSHMMLQIPHMLNFLTDNVRFHLLSQCTSNEMFVW